MRLDDWVLCRVRRKQHGVDDWPVHYSSEPTTTRDAAAVLPPEAVVPPATAYDDAGIDWMNSDGQLLHYLIGGDGRSPPDPPAGASAHPGGDSAPPPHSSLVSVLETIKRNLSFQAIDELYLLQPSKRANCMTVRGHDEQTSSFSISEADDEVFF
ncbi:NAC domain-containing protein 72-like [Panicum miliaceum]|nr:NAC domain-containing protein 72-like [Panicum miliaceum]